MSRDRSRQAGCSHHMVHVYMYIVVLRSVESQGIEVVECVFVSLAGHGAVVGLHWVGVA